MDVDPAAGSAAREDPPPGAHSGGVPSLTISSKTSEGGLPRLKIRFSNPAAAAKHGAAAKPEAAPRVAPDGAADAHAASGGGPDNAAGGPAPDTTGPPEAEARDGASDAPATAVAQQNAGAAAPTATAAAPGVAPPTESGVQPPQTAPANDGVAAGGAPPAIADPPIPAADAVAAGGDAPMEGTTPARDASGAPPPAPSAEAMNAAAPVSDLAAAKPDGASTAMAVDAPPQDAGPAGLPIIPPGILGSASAAADGATAEAGSGDVPPPASAPPNAQAPAAPPGEPSKDDADAGAAGSDAKAAPGVAELKSEPEIKADAKTEVKAEGEAGAGAAAQAGAQGADEKKDGKAASIAAPATFKTAQDAGYPQPIVPSESKPKTAAARKGPSSGRAGPSSHKKKEKEKLTTKDALSYLKDVKTQFKNDRHVYEAFLEVMKRFKAGVLDTHGVVLAVKELFKGRKDLILGFNAFLPKGFEIKWNEASNKKGAKPKKQAGGKAKKGAGSKQPVEFDQAISYVNKIKTRFANDERVYKAFLEILNMYRKGKKGIYRVYEEVRVLFRDHPDLLKEFTYFLPDSQPPPGSEPAGKGGASQKKRAGGRGKDDGRKGGAKKARGMPGAKGAKEDEDKNIKLSLASLGKELQFFERVKNRLRNKEAYQDFLKCLNIFSQEIISKMELQGLVYDIIGKYPDLVQGFNEFLGRCESMDLDPSVKSMLGKDGKALEQAKQQVSSKDVQNKLRAISLREKYNTRPISDLDLTACEQCTPSYRRLPHDYPKMTFTGRDKRAHPKLKQMWGGMLTESWVSMPTGSEDAYGNQYLRRNQYEEALFRCEDDRFEMEMCIECNASAMRALEPVVAEIEKAVEETGSDEQARRNFVLREDVLSPVHLRSIEKLYGDHAPTILELLRHHPGHTAPVVLGRLKEKDAEWRHVQEEMNKVWRKVYEQNYHKSLDHRSFYFKQVDKKNLSTKGMLQEIRDASEQRRKALRPEDRLAGALATLPPPTMVAGFGYGTQFGGPLTPGAGWAARVRAQGADMTFECTDAGIHDKIFSVVSYAADEMLSGDLSDKVQTFWRQFLEAFLGLPPRTKSEGKALVSKDKGAKDGEEDEGEAMDVDEKEDEEENEDEEEDDEDDDEDEEDSFAQCTPVASCMGRVLGGTGYRGQASKQGKENEKTLGASGVFYGHEAFYALFRLHFYLYERLAISQQCAAQVDANPAAYQHKGSSPPPSLKGGSSGGSGEGKKEPAGEERKKSKDGKKDKEGAGDKADKDDKRAKALAPGTTHAAFMTLLFQLIDGTTDAGGYEDACRHLLGAKAYMLFTIDKLIYKLVKQVQALVTDELPLKLVALHAQYETRRSKDRFDDAVFYANALVLLHEGNDQGPRFRFEHTGDGVVGVNMLDHPRAGLAHLGAFGPAPAAPKAGGAGRTDDKDAKDRDGGDGNAGGTNKSHGGPESGAASLYFSTTHGQWTPALAMDKAFSDYLDHFVDLDSSNSLYEPGRVFLQRSLQIPSSPLPSDKGGKGGKETKEGKGKKDKGSDKDDKSAEEKAELAREAALSAALAQFTVRNGLECKVACATSKVSYVLDTEDVLFRKKGAKDGAQEENGGGTGEREQRKASRSSAKKQAKPDQDPTLPGQRRKKRFDKWLEAAAAKAGA